MAASAASSTEIVSRLRRCRGGIGYDTKRIGEWGGVRYTGWLWRRDLNQED
jgi:hypothetical protein